MCRLRGSASPAGRRIRSGAAPGGANRRSEDVCAVAAVHTCIWNWPLLYMLGCWAVGLSGQSACQLQCNRAMACLRYGRLNNIGTLCHTGHRFVSTVVCSSRLIITFVSPWASTHDARHGVRLLVSGSLHHFLLACFRIFGVKAV